MFLKISGGNCPVTPSLLASLFKPHFNDKETTALP